MAFSNEFILIIIIILIQFLFIMYQFSLLKNENFNSTTDIETQIATFYQADIASIQALGNVAKALITGGNIVPGNLTISGDLNVKSKLTAPTIINTPTFTNGLGLPLGQKIYLQSNITGNNLTADTISAGTFDQSAMNIVGHGNENAAKNIHLWDDVVVDRNLTVKNSLHVKGDFQANKVSYMDTLYVTHVIVGAKIHIGKWDITADDNYIYFNNVNSNQGVQFYKDGGGRFQHLRGTFYNNGYHARMER
jgi:hypothetical protein